MTITLADIEASEKICDAAAEGPWEEDRHGVSIGPQNTECSHTGNKKNNGITYGSVIRGPNKNEVLGIEGFAKDGRGPKPHPNYQFVAHARTRLPEMNKLVREMSRHIVGLLEEMPTKLGGSVAVKAERLIERMEGGK